MRFNEQIHWSEGLFLQPHHLQYFQRQAQEALRAERSLAFPYAFGLLDFEIDAEALAARRVVVTRLSAVLPSGVEVSMPGNTALQALTIDPPAAEGAVAPAALTVYLAVPSWSPIEGNLAESPREERPYTVADRVMRDENTGESEADIMVRRINACLTLDPASRGDCTALPILRLAWISRAGSEPRLAVDRSYMGPFLLITGDCPLCTLANELLFELRQRRDKIQSDLEETGFNTETLSGVKLHQMLQLLALNRFEARMGGELAPGRLTPLELYTEMRVLLGELSALQPLSRCESVPFYNHLDALDSIMEIVRRLRSLMLAEGTAGYVRTDFVRTPREGTLEARLNEDALQHADACYLAIRTSRDDSRALVEEVESGNTFRLTDPSAIASRIRGAKLTEMRYPPRYLPVLSRTVWFRVETGGSAWQSISNARHALIDSAASVFPNLEASLFITVLRSR